jgi:tetratricopeptide (TPR) repeat protein
MKHLWAMARSVIARAVRDVIHTLNEKRAEIVRPAKYSLIVLAVVLGLALCFEGYQYFLLKGLVYELAGILCFLVYTRMWRDNRKTSGDAKPSARIHWDLFFVSAILFLVCCPFFNSLHPVGLVPGLLFLLLFSHLCADLSKRSSPANMIALVVLAVFSWLWVEAGRPGLVVMPVDLPEGRNDMNFTADGVANALETELQNFGANESDGTYGDTEASKILATDFATKLFPQSPWYKGSNSRPPMLEGLQVSHVIVGTNVEGFPLTGLYHILRHLRGMPLLEGQILIGDDHSLTLALRRSNAPLNCTAESGYRSILKQGASSGVAEMQSGRSAVNFLWKSTERDFRAWARINPDNLGCSGSRVRTLLDLLGVFPSPSLSEERIANVTVHDLKGDERVTVALHLAALQATEHLSPERLAIYYDNAGKYDSSLYFFQAALSGLLEEAYDSPAIFSEFPRQRLANALVRIGDFKAQLRHDCADTGASLREMRASFDSADSAYVLARAVFPDDQVVQGRIGYGYLVRSKELRWIVQVCGWDTSGEFAKAADAQLRLALENLKSAVAVQESEAISRYGSEWESQNISWVYSNLAYVLVSMPKGEQDFKYATNAIALAVKSSETDPLRPSIVREYVLLRTTPSDAQGTDFCADRLKSMKKLDPAITDTVSSPLYKVPLTLHGSLIVEEQLLEIYNTLYHSHCQPMFTDRRCKAAEHKLLFRSLLALSYRQNGAPHPERPLIGLQKNSSECFELAINAIKNDLAEESAKSGASHALGSKGQVDTGERMQDLSRRIKALEQQSRDVEDHLALELAFLKVKDVDVCQLVPGTSRNSARAESMCAKLQALSCKGTPDQLSKATRSAEAVPDDAFLRANLGIVQLKLRDAVAQKDPNDALLTLQDAVRLNPRDPELRYLLSFALNSSKRPQEAKEQLDYGRSLDPQGWLRIRDSIDVLSLSPCAWSR